jgi:hypothetical protein
MPSPSLRVVHGGGGYRLLKEYQKVGKVNDRNNLILARLPACH